MTEPEEETRCHECGEITYDGAELCAPCYYQDDYYCEVCGTHAPDDEDDDDE